MAQDQQPSHHDNSEHDRLAGLRSEPLGVLPSIGKKKSSTSLLVIIGGIVILVIAIVGIGMAAGWFSGKNVSQQAANVFNQLPLAGNNGAAQPEVVNNGYSGLSGLTCEHPNRRPIGVMLAGDPINRPLSGASQADLMVEMPVLTNGVTRLMGVYQCNEPPEMGSVRSARHDYLFLIEGFDGILAHWGGSYHALNRIAAGEFQTINALTNPYDAFFRKSNLPAPYNGFTTYARVWNALQKLGYRTETTFKGYQFKDDAPMAERPAGGTLTVNWPGAFRVSYQYDQATNRYVRYWADVKQIDVADHKPVAPSAVVVMRATNQLADGPGGYNDEGIEGKGDMTVYQDGKAIPGTWTKDENNKKDPLHFLNQQGQPIVFTRGQLWIMAVEPDKSVTWQTK